MSKKPTIVLHLLLCVIFPATMAMHCTAQNDRSQFTADALARLSHVKLTDEQTARIVKLAAEFESQIAVYERLAADSPEQLASRQAAIKRAIAAGKKGSDAAEMIASAATRSSEQRNAARSVRHLHAEFERSVEQVLTDAQRQKLPERPLRVAKLSGIVVIRLDLKLAEDSGKADSFDSLARLHNLKAITDILNAYGLKSPIRAVDTSELDQTRADLKLIRRLESYWCIDATTKTQSIDALVERLNRIPEIDVAYAELAISEPSGTIVNPDDDPHSTEQGYLDAAPTGIDARTAWTRPHASGTGVGIVDLERSWNITHEDLIDHPPILIHGSIKSGDHGTAVLGEIAAMDNASGVVGIAPSVSYVFLSSWHPSNKVAQAIVSALALMNQGDVLLLEVERYNLPTEIDDCDFDAICLATSMNVIVIEAAGNGGEDLDAYVNHEGKRILDTDGDDFRDSGAILVGASDPRDNHKRISWSCYGSRVNCFAWGRHVVTCGYGDLEAAGGDSDKQYTRTFGGTSSAAPIIAGAALIVQSFSIGNSSTFVTPSAMRDLLSNPSTATAQGMGVPGNIGVMPDLKAVLDSL